MTFLLACVLAFSLGMFRVAAAQGTYTNPILFADYSDPDVIRIGSDYYLVASSFHFSPGLPILHSRDLVHWELAGHALKRLTMSPGYDMRGETKYGQGVWAPAVRFHAGLFYLYFPTPKEGIFVVTAAQMTGPWSDPVAVLPGPGLEDPCPFWDSDGKAWLIHSRTGAGPLILHRMAGDGMHVLDEGYVIVKDPVNLPTLEGPKLYKHGDWYTLFAPFGGVGTGSEVVLRARSLEGPWERRIVLAQGASAINGPHQGGYVETPDGTGWFVHFQQRGAHGRIVWLEPVAWKDGWPVMGTAVAGAAEPGEPVQSYATPIPGGTAIRPATSDEFSEDTLADQWEWNHNPDAARWSLTERRGFLRLTPGLADSLLTARNTLTESMQDEAFEVTTRLDAGQLADGDQAGLSLFERGLSGIGVLRRDGRLFLFLTAEGKATEGAGLTRSTVELRAKVVDDTVQYAYSTDNGQTFEPAGGALPLKFSWWKGARPALFAFNPQGASRGAADFDWVHYTPIPVP